MFAKCTYCHRRFTLKTHTNFLGIKKALNYVVISKLGDSPKYMHKTCSLRYRRDKIKERKYRLSGGITTGIANIKGEIEEN